MLSRESLLRFAYFRLPLMVENSTSSPSVLAQTTLDCGRPSGSIVATVAWLRPSNSSRARSGSSAMDTSHSLAHPRLSFSRAPSSLVLSRALVSRSLAFSRAPSSHHFGRRGPISDQAPPQILDLGSPYLTETRTYPGSVEFESDIWYEFCNESGTSWVPARIRSQNRVGCRVPRAADGLTSSCEPPWPSSRHTQGPPRACSREPAAAAGMCRS